MGNLEQRLTILEQDTVRAPVCIFRLDGKIDDAAQERIERAARDGREVRFIDYAIIGGAENGDR